MTKHKQIIDYIRELKPGSKISVRRIAQDLNVSEGTAYRAIKEAENLNVVNTVPRIGTVRIEIPEKKSIEQLTYKEILDIVEGTALGGYQGLNKTLNKFVIGAMTAEEMVKYLSPGDLLIVGNREPEQETALRKGCAVLISGGFRCSEEVRKLSDELGLPVISSSYDTFTIASQINRAISDKLVKKDIILVEDILVRDPVYLKTGDTVAEWKNKMKSTGHGRFPVVNDSMKIVGIVTGRDVSNAAEEETIGKVMTREPVTVTPRTTVAYASQLMVWEGVELIPVVEDKVLVGVISRQDVIKALQYIRNQPQVGETIDSLILNGFSIENTESGISVSGKISQFMVNYFGTVSCGALSVLMLFTAAETVRRHRHFEILTDSLSVYFIKPAQLDWQLELNSKIMDSGRKNCKIEIEALCGKELIAKALVSVKVHKGQNAEY